MSGYKSRLQNVCCKALVERALDWPVMVLHSESLLSYEELHLRLYGVVVDVLTGQRYPQSPEIHKAEFNLDWFRATRFFPASTAAPQF